MPKKNKTKATPKPTPESSNNSGLYIIVLSILVVLASVFFWQLLQGRRSNFREQAHAVQPSIQYVQRNSTFPLLDSQNPNFDQSEMMRMYQQFKPWTPYHPPTIRSTAEIPSSPIQPFVGIDEKNRWQVIVGRTRFTFLTSKLLRMEWDKDAHFHDDPSLIFSERENYMKENPDKKPIVKIFDDKENGEILSIHTSFLHIRYGVDQVGKRYIESPPLNEETLSIRILNEKGQIVENWFPGKSDHQNLGGTVRTLDRTRGPVPLEPGLLSVSGWSFIDDTFSPFLKEESSENKTKFGFDTWAEERNPPKFYSDWYLFGYGNNYRECLGDYVQVAGRIPLPPKYAFGVWWSRWWSYSDSELMDLVDEFRANMVPLDNLVIDMDWHLTSYTEMDAGAVDLSGQPLGWTGYSWNYTLFPSPPSFFHWCHQEGLQTTLNLHPAAGIQPHEYCYPDMARAMDMDPNQAIHVPFDITDRKFTRNYFDIVIKPLEAEGVDFWWLDYQQLQVTNITNLNPTIWLNHCFFKHMEEKNRLPSGQTTRGLIFHRWGGLGSHRYQIGFSGDTESNWNALTFQVYFTARAANVGFGYWSHDIGGFMSNRQTHPELYTRWVQWGALSPIFRTHAWRQEFIERRIWKYSGFYYWCMREAIYFRYSMMPYLYTEARNSYDTGVSMFYPVFYDYPFDEDAYLYETQGMLGSRILFSPVTMQASQSNFYAKKDLYLPGDDEIWIEWNTLTSLSSGEYHRKVAVDEMPVYVREGSILPMHFMDNKVMNLKDQEKEPLMLSIFPGPRSASGNYTLYEDDGVTLDYQNPSHSGVWTFFESSLVNSAEDKTTWKVVIHPSSGDYKGMDHSRQYIIRFVGVAPPSKVSMHGGNLIRNKGYVASSSREQSDSFMHWSMSRDSSIYPEKGEASWVYDYNRFTLIIQTPSLSRSSLHSLEIQWENTPRKLWNELQETLHKGWCGYLNTIQRANFLLQNRLDAVASPCLELPENLSNLPNSQWKERLSGFQNEYKLLLKHAEDSLDTTSQFQQIILSHLKSKEIK